MSHWQTAAELREAYESARIAHHDDPNDDSRVAMLEAEIAMLRGRSRAELASIVAWCFTAKDGPQFVWGNAPHELERLDAEHRARLFPLHDKPLHEGQRPFAWRIGGPGVAGYFASNDLRFWDPAFVGPELYAEFPSWPANGAASSFVDLSADPTVAHALRKPVAVMRAEDTVLGDSRPPEGATRPARPPEVWLAPNPAGSWTRSDVGEDGAVRYVPAPPRPNAGTVIDKLESQAVWLRSLRGVAPAIREAAADTCELAAWAIRQSVKPASSSGGVQDGG